MHSVDRPPPSLGKVGPETGGSLLKSSCPPDLVDQVAAIDAERVGDLENLDEVEASRAPLVFGDKRLRTAESRCEPDLGQPSIATRRDQTLSQAPVGRAEQRPGHECCHTTVAGTLIRGWDYPNMG